MIHGLDTGFLVAAEVLEHADHVAARSTLAQVVAAGDSIAIALQILAAIFGLFICITPAGKSSSP